MAEQRLPVTGLIPGKIGPAVLVCGDPGRAMRMAEQLDEAVLLNEQREYRAYQGLYKGMPVTICSHGIGAPGAAIAFEELVAAGGRAIVRVGTCGGLQPDVLTGDLVVATAAVQNTGYGHLTVPTGFPAVADMGLTLALGQAAVGNGRSSHCGFVLTSDSFYPGIAARRPDYEAMSQANVLAVEMECAALFIVGSLRRVRTAAILAVDGNVLHSGESMVTYDPHRSEVAEAIEAATHFALKALSHITHDV